MEECVDGSTVSCREKYSGSDGLLAESGGRGVHEAEGCHGHGGEDGGEFGRHIDKCEGLGWTALGLTGGSLTLSGLVQ